MIKETVNSFLGIGFNVVKGIGSKELVNTSKRMVSNMTLYKKTGRTPPKKPDESVIYIPREIDLTNLHRREQACTHAFQRRETFGLTCTTLAALSSLKLIPVNEVLEIVGAVWQASHGSKAKGSEAAHLNLMMLLGGRPLTSFVKGAFQQASIQCLYTHTHLVDASVNKIDSRLEKAYFRRYMPTELNKFIRRLYGCSNISEIESILYSNMALLSSGAVHHLDLIYKDIESKQIKLSQGSEKDKLDASLEVVDEYKKAWEAKKPIEGISRPMIINCIDVFKEEKVD